MDICSAKAQGKDWMKMLILEEKGKVDNILQIDYRWMMCFTCFL